MTTPGVSSWPYKEGKASREDMVEGYQTIYCYLFYYEIYFIIKIIIYFIIYYYYAIYFIFIAMFYLFIKLFSNQPNIATISGYCCWNELPVDLRDLTVGPATFAKHLKTHLFRVGFF